MDAALALCFAWPIAHRGLHACGRPGPVENSIGAALAAIEGGFAIECDVQLSRDGEAMVFHDDRLDRLTARSGVLEDHTSHELIRIGLRGSRETIPTLPDFLGTIGGRVPLVIEIKQRPNEDFRLTDRVLALVDSYRGDVVIESFDPLVVARCLEAPCPIGLVGPCETGDEPERPLPARCDFLSWSIDHLASIANRHAALPRTTWTVRTPEQSTLAASHNAQIVFEGFNPRWPSSTILHAPALKLQHLCNSLIRQTCSRTI